MANIGFSSPNDMVAIICERIDNGNDTYTLLPNAVSFGRVENNMFYPEDNTQALPNVEDTKAISNPELKTFYVFARPIDELQQFYNVTNLNMLAVCYYTDVQKRVILALNEGGYIQVVSDELDNFMGDIFVEQKTAAKANDILLPSKEIKIYPSVLTKANGEMDLTHIDNFAMEKYLKERIFENDDIIEDICTTIAMNYAAKNREEIESLLSIGPTGCGKTETYKLIAEYLGVPCTIYDCNSLTAAGYVGESVEDVIKKVYANSGGDKTLAEKSILVLDEIDKLAMRGSDVKEEKVQDALLKLLDGYEYTISAEKGGKAINIDTSFMTKAGLGAFPDIYDKKKKAKVGFTAPGAKEEEVEEEIEITTEDLVKFGMLAELIGRFNDPFLYSALTNDSFVRILKQSKSSPILFRKNRYLEEFNTTLDVEDEFLYAIVEKALKKKTGARSLKKVVNSTFKKVDRELIYLRNTGKLDKPKVLKLTPDTVQDNRRFTVE